MTRIKKRRTGKKRTSDLKKLLPEEVAEGKKPGIDREKESQVSAAMEKKISSYTKATVANKPASRKSAPVKKTNPKKTARARAVKTGSSPKP